MTILAGALLGLLGSLHCLGMCGPLVLAVGAPPRELGATARLGHVLLYHAGRIATYAALGLAAGLLGYVAALTGAGRVLAVSGGVLLVVAAVQPSRVTRGRAWAGGWMRVAARAAAAARSWRAGHRIAGPLLTGMANGLLPCGMVYAAVAAALAAGGPGQAVLTMVAFGAGTTPALAALSLTAAQVPGSWRQRLAGTARVGLAIAGVLLVVRGLP